MKYFEQPYLPLAKFHVFGGKKGTLPVCSYEPTEYPELRRLMVTQLVRVARLFGYELRPIQAHMLISERLEFPIEEAISVKVGD